MPILGRITHDAGAIEWNTRNRPEPGRTRHLFTLRELLVVIAIIAILAALIMPALEKARHSATTAVCAGDLHQTYLGMAMYQSDYDSVPFNKVPGGNILWTAGDVRWRTMPGHLQSHPLTGGTTGTDEGWARHGVGTPRVDAMVPIGVIDIMYTSRWKGKVRIRPGIQWSSPYIALE